MRVGRPPWYVAALLAADGEATVLTEAFGVGWPNAPHRKLRSALQAAEAFQGEVVGVLHAGPRPSRCPAVGPHAQPGGDRHGRGHGLHAGQGVGQVTQVTPAAQVVAELAQEAQRRQRR